jgi:hypothetical protein
MEAIMSTTTRSRIVIALFVVAFGLLYACSSTASDDGQADSPLETDSVEDATPVGADSVQADPVQATPVQTAPVADTSTGNGNQNNDPAPSDPAPSDPAPPTDSAPVIDSFDTPPNIDCHNGNSQTFTASWTTTNATEVVISIDGAGPFGTYEPDGSTSLPFDCSSSHTFLLTARSADGQEATTSITLDPRNAQPPADGHELDDATNDTAMDDTMPAAP